MPLNKTVRFLCLSTVLLCTACTVPVPTGHVIKHTPQCSDECVGSILIVSDRHAQAEVVKVSPLALAISKDYAFKVNQSTAMILKNLFILKRYKSSFQVMDSLNISALEYDDYALTFQIVDHNIDMGTMMLSEHAVSVNVRYTVYDKQGEVVLRATTSGSSRTSMTGGELSHFVLIPFETEFQQSSFARAVGRAWDMAVLDSAHKFYQKFAEALP